MTVSSTCQCSNQHTFSFKGPSTLPRSNSCIMYTLCPLTIFFLFSGKEQTNMAAPRGTQIQSKKYLLHKYFYELNYTEIYTHFLFSLSGQLTSLLSHWCPLYRRYALAQQNNIFTFKKSPVYVIPAYNSKNKHNSNSHILVLTNNWLIMIQEVTLPLMWAPWDIETSADLKVSADGSHVQSPQQEGWGGCDLHTVIH